MSGINTQSLAHSGGAPPPVAVSQQQFLQHITAMQQHYRAVDPTGAQSISPYLLPAELIPMVPHVPAGARVKPTAPEVQRSPGTPATDAAAERQRLIFANLVAIGTPEPASKLMAEALDNQHQRTLAFINNHRDAMLQATAPAKDSRSAQAFAQQMDALRDRAKADHEARIDAMFASLTAIGTAHPLARPVILGTGNKVGGFVAGVAAEALKVAGTVKSAVAAGGSAIGKAAEAVGKWASGAAQSVGHFFSKLF
jgi:hypothetical protein